jgi:hypothetical protein
MTRRSGRFRILSLVTMIVACRGGSHRSVDAGDPSRAAWRRVGDELVSLSDDMAKAAETADGDCVVLASTLESLIDLHGDVISESKQLSAEWRAEKWFQENYGNALVGNFGRFERAAGKCAKDARVVRALTRMRSDQNPR